MTFLQIYCFLDTVGDPVLKSVFDVQSKSFTPGDAIHFARGVGYSSLWILYFFTDDVLGFFSKANRENC